MWSAPTELFYDVLGEDKINAHAHFRHIESTSTNHASERRTGMAIHDWGYKIGPSKISFYVSHYTLDYNHFFVVFPVLGRRMNRSRYGTVEAKVTDAIYISLVPVVSFRSEKSRFNMDPDRISFGMRSEF